MTETRLDVLGIGNAIVDVLAHAEDDFLDSQGLVKGAMTLISDDRARALYQSMGQGIAVSGGSAANTMAGLASLGARAGFIGKVRDDAFGDVFGHDLRALGVEFATPPANSGPSTASCLILVTPDAQRTMNTYLGACADLGPGDVDGDLVASARITYLEGYLWDPPAAKEAFRKAMTAARQADRRVALTLSDAFCVDRYREEFVALIEAEVDILFANEAEIISLYQARDFDEALQQVRGQCQIVALTRGEKGAVIVSGDEVHVIDAEPVTKIVDTTGAGDLFAAGFLYGLTHGLDLRASGRAGGIAAAEVISHFGARPETALSALIRDKLG